MPTTFNDTSGRQWDVSLTVGAIKRVREALGLSLADLSEQTLASLIDDPSLIADVCWHICKPAAGSVTEEQFYAGLDGPTVDAASSALLEAVVNFCRSPRRPLVQKILDKLRRVEAAAASVIEKRLDNPATEAAMLAAILGTAPTDSAGNSPESSASTQIR